MIEKKLRRLSTGEVGRIRGRSTDRHTFVVEGITFKGHDQWPDWDVFAIAPWWWKFRHPRYWLRAKRS